MVWRRVDYTLLYGGYGRAGEGVRKGCGVLTLLSPLPFLFSLFSLLSSFPLHPCSSFYFRRPPTPSTLVPL